MLPLLNFGPPLELMQLKLLVKSSNYSSHGKLIIESSYGYPKQYFYNFNWLHFIWFNSLHCLPH